MTIGPRTTHGKAGAYRRGCRCEPCTVAHSIDCRRRRWERRTRLEDIREHGKATTYGNWGCRCPKCSAAHARKMREQAARRKART